MFGTHIARMFICYRVKHPLKSSTLWNTFACLLVLCSVCCCALRWWNNNCIKTHNKRTDRAVRNVNVTCTPPSDQRVHEGCVKFRGSSLIPASCLILYCGLSWYKSCHLLFLFPTKSLPICTSHMCIYDLHTVQIATIMASCLHLYAISQQM